MPTYMKIFALLALLFGIAGVIRYYNQMHRKQADKMVQECLQRPTDPKCREPDPSFAPTPR